MMRVVRLLAHRALAVRNAVALVSLVVLTRRPVELWVGDSHAQAHNGPRTNTVLSRRRDRVFVWYLGPRLAWSVANRGFPGDLQRFLRLVGRLPRRGGVVLCVLLGEIDVRAHLAARAPQARDDFGFVGSYVGRIAELSGVLRARQVVVVTPPPPTPGGAFNPDWPVRGSFTARLTQFDALRRALAQEVATAGSEFVLLDLTPELEGPDRGLAAALTDDQVHLNAAGVVIVRRAMAELVET